VSTDILSLVDRLTKARDKAQKLVLPVRILGIAMIQRSVRFRQSCQSLLQLESEREL
jgi:hypothetical protein